MRPARIATWFVCLVLLYLWLVVTGTRDEALVAAVTAAAVLLFLMRLERIAGCSARVPLAGWLSVGGRAPYAALRESLDLLGPVLWRAVVRGERVAGRWISVRYASDAGGAQDDFGRRTLVVFGANVTPNALPLAIDGARERIILHQIVHRREAAADHPQYPI